MSEQKSYVGDIGTVILLDCGTDITGATKVEIRTRKPDKSEHIWPAVVDATKYVKYVVQPGDFDMKGNYLFQAYVETPAWKGLGETVKWQVYEKFK